LLNIHATLIADFPKSGSASFQEMDGYFRTYEAIEIALYHTLGNLWARA
jgi:hypothetical protein